MSERFAHVTHHGAYEGLSSGHGEWRGYRVGLDSPSIFSSGTAPLS